MAALACCFGRAEPRRQARKYIAGLMSGSSPKNCWTLAQEAGDRTPDKMQRLLGHAAWDHRAAMGAVAGFAAGRLGGQDAVVVIDESGQLKKGDRTAGVKRQYVGCAGRVENAGRGGSSYCTQAERPWPGMP